MKAVQFRGPTAQNTSEKPSLKHLLNPGPKTRNYLIKNKYQDTTFSRSLKPELDVLFYGLDYHNNIETCLSTGHKT